jgi:hypothetical protein
MSVIRSDVGFCCWPFSNRRLWEVEGHASSALSRLSAIVAAGAVVSLPTQSTPIFRCVAGSSGGDLAALVESAPPAHYIGKAEEFESLAKEARDQTLKQHYKLLAEEYRGLAKY